MKRIIIGIRKEDEKKKAERRTPLIPSDIEALLSENPGLEIWLQSSDDRGYIYERCFSDEEFRLAGARPVEQLTQSPTILGLKEIPICDLEPAKVYIFFSHTFKRQPNNMQMLKRLLRLGCTLIDYEMIVIDASEEEFAAKQREATRRETAPASLLKRTVYFGKFAGISGVIDCLWALGQRLTLEGYETHPLSDLKKAMDYSAPDESFGTYSLAEAAIRAAGVRLSEEGFPDRILPVIIGITGRGNTAEGTEEILRLLPHRVIEDPSQLPLVLANAHEAKHHIYIVRFGREHTCCEVFPTLLPRLTVVMNCIKWQSDEPRLITRQMLRDIYAASSPPRLLVIGDVTCDPGGSIEISRETFPDEPVYTYDPPKDNPELNWQDEAEREELFELCCVPGVGLQGPVIMAVTNLPCEFPRDASISFSEMLRPYVPDLARVAEGESLEDLRVAPAVRRAIMSFKGELTPDYFYLEEAVRSRNVLVLGAGMVSPLLLHDLDRAGFKLRVLDRNPEASRSRVESLNSPRASHGKIDVRPTTDPQGLYEEFCKADLVVSLLPPAHHLAVARACIKARVPLITASYTGEMQGLHEEARAAGIVLLNEMGLDPGIDHVSALRMLRDSQSAGEELETFRSYCGGLPAPECSQNPLGYKFSWRVLGPLGALQQGSTFLENGASVETPALVEQEPLALEGFENSFEVFANRNSLPYIAKYDAGSLKSFLRATLRYPGWGSIWRALRNLGWLGASTDGILPRSAVEVAAHLDLSESDELVIRVAWILHHVQPTSSPLSDLALALESIPELQYLPGERDMVVMHHRLTSVTTAGRRILRTATLILKGSDMLGGLHAMALTTGGMLAIGAQLILEGKIRQTGVLDPTDRQVAALAWPELEKKGISFKETEEEI